MITTVKKIGAVVSVFLNLLSFSGLTSAVNTWLLTWRMNRTSIILLTSVNTGLTVVSEMLSREISVKVSGKKEFGFFVKSQRTTIHRQSLINIFMTIIASLFGGPVYFFQKRVYRFLFFLHFGLLNSFISQVFSGLLRDGRFMFAGARLIFDVIYSGTIKYFIFERGREYIISFQQSITKIGGLRAFQDFLCTFFRVFILNALGFKG